MTTKETLMKELEECFESYQQYNSKLLESYRSLAKGVISTMDNQIALYEALGSAMPFQIQSLTEGTESLKTIRQGYVESHIDAYHLEDDILDIHLKRFRSLIKELKDEE